MDRPSRLLSHTMRLCSVPDASAMDTLRLPALAATVQSFIWLRYVTLIKEKCVTDWRVFRSFCTKTGIQVKCANGQLIEASGVGDVGFFTHVLLVLQLKNTFLRGN